MNIAYLNLIIIYLICWTAIINVLLSSSKKKGIGHVPIAAILQYSQSRACHILIYRLECEIISKQFIVIWKKDNNQNNNKKCSIAFIHFSTNTNWDKTTQDQFKSSVIVGQRGRVIDWTMLFNNMWLRMTLFYILVLYMEAHRVRHVVPPCLFHCSPVHHFP